MRMKIDLKNVQQERPKILLVDDERRIQFAVKKLLQEHYDVEVAGDGEEALRICANAERDFNLIILDFSMPKLDGKGFTKELSDRTAKQGKARPPILVMTAHADPDSVTAMAALKVQSYLIKPVSMERLEQRVGEFLDPNLNVRALERRRLAERWAAQERPRESLTKIEDLLEQDPLNRDIRIIAANLAITVGEIREANYHARVAHASDPESVEANVLVALSYVRMGEDRAAQVFLKSAKVLLGARLGEK